MSDSEFQDISSFMRVDKYEQDLNAKNKEIKRLQEEILKYINTAKDTDFKFNLISKQLFKKNFLINNITNEIFLLSAKIIEFETEKQQRKNQLQQTEKKYQQLLSEVVKEKEEQLQLNQELNQTLGQVQQKLRQQQKSQNIIKEKLLIIEIQLEQKTMELAAKTQALEQKDKALRQQLQKISILEDKSQNETLTKQILELRYQISNQKKKYQYKISQLQSNNVELSKQILELKKNIPINKINQKYPISFEQNQYQWVQLIQQFQNQKKIIHDQLQNQEKSFKAKQTEFYKQKSLLQFKLRQFQKQKFWNQKISKQLSTTKAQLEQAKRKIVQLNQLIEQNSQKYKTELLTLQMISKDPENYLSVLNSKQNKLSQNFIVTIFSSYINNLIKSYDQMRNSNFINQQQRISLIDTDFKAIKDQLNKNVCKNCIFNLILPL